MLRGIDLTLPAGQSLVLTGANGAGKTTLLRILATLLKPTSGAGTICGFDLATDADGIRARTAYVSARGFVYDDLTAAENLRFAARLVGADANEARIDQVLVSVGLDNTERQSVRTFSTGMRRRLALASLQLRPLGLALIDEPYAGLDGDGAALVDRVIADLLAAGTTVVVASHQDGEATRRASMSFRLEDGRLV